MSNCSKILPITAALLLVTAPVLADEFLSVKAGYISLSPEGVFAGNDGLDGTKIDLEDDLDADDSDKFTGEVALQFGNSRLSLGYLPFKFDGRGVLDTDVTFNGETYPIGEAVDSEIEADIYDLAYTYYILNFDDTPSRFQLGLELAVKITDADIKLSSETVGTERVSGTAPIPTLGLRSRIALADFIGLIGRVGYIEYDENKFVDADIQVEFSPLPMVGIFAGYRYFDLKVDESDVFIDAEFSGLYAGALFRF